MAAIEAAGKVEEDLIIDRRNPLSARCSWTIPDIKGKIKLRAVWSKYFDVGGYDCRLLVYPGGANWMLGRAAGPSPSLQARQAGATGSRVPCTPVASPTRVGHRAPMHGNKRHSREAGCAGALAPVAPAPCRAGVQKATQACCTPAACSGPSRCRSNAR